MKRGHIIALRMILCLVAGMLAGLLFPRGALPWDNSWTDSIPTLSTTPAVPITTNVATQTEAVSNLNARDNIPLLEATADVLEALDEWDYVALSTLIDSELGLTFTPYSSVNPDTDLTLTAQQIKNGEDDTTLYKWGFYDGIGDTISLTISDYFAEYVYDADYTQAAQFSIDKVLISGNALENVTEAYPDCRFVELSYPSRDPDYSGMDWCSLKLVFTPGETQWKLVGIIHGEWTI